LLISARTMVSGGTSFAVFGNSIALTEAGADSSTRAQKPKSTSARHDSFVSTAFFIFQAFPDKSINSHFSFTHPGLPGRSIAANITREPQLMQSLEFRQ
jgi:hypothetical protein